MKSNHDAARSSESPISTGRQSWVTPSLQRIQAGSAEAGANPVAPEGTFASGSPRS